MERYLSSLCLKASTEHPDKFRMWAGSVLNNLGPLIPKLASLIDCICLEVLRFMAGTVQERPLRGFQYSWMPEFSNCEKLGT